MPFYTTETIIGLSISVIPALISIYVFLVLKKERLALGFLLLSAFGIRLLMASLDPFIHSWDERFHALVAKNMMEHPFKPMLRVNPILEYDYKAWCCNHIWLHKQPLFLWQMALSMKIFGVHLLSMRLPSILMGTIGVLLTFDIARFWTQNRNVAFLAALLWTFSFYQLELVAGRFPTEHNDMAFLFYVTASIWAFVRYIESEFKWKWAIGIGLFIGCAVLTKWLTGLVVFGAWGLYLLLNPSFLKAPNHYFKFIVGVLTACLVFVPWQVYTHYAFPLESAWEHEYNRLHIFEVVETHGGDIYYHFNQLLSHYDVKVLLFTFLGLICSFITIPFKKLSLALFAIVGVIFFFFSVIVATKMPSFTYPTHVLINIYTAIGVYFILNLLKQWSSKFNISLGITVLSILTFITFPLLNLQAHRIVEYRSIHNTKRNNKIHNTIAYKAITNKIKPNTVVLNTENYEDLELMFFQDAIAYSIIPKKSIIDSLEQKQYNFMIYTQIWYPEHIRTNPNIEILDFELKKK